MIPPSSHPTYGLKPRLQPRANGRPSSFGSLQPRRTQDQVHFGNRQTDGGPVRYQQHGPSWVLETYPVTGNNCQICSVKNMLRHFGLEPAAIEDIMEKGLKPFLLEEIPVPNNPGLKHKRGLFIDDPDYPERYEINPEVLREFLTEKLGIQLDQGHTFGRQNYNANNSDEEAQRQFLVQCAEISYLTTPLLIGLGSDVPNPNGTRTGQKYGHAIFAYPVPGTNTWHIVDSEKDRISILTRDAFENYILNSAYQHQMQLFPIKEGPKPEKIAQFSRVEESSDVSEISTPAETPSEAGEEPESVEESSEAPEIASPIETSSESVEEAKPAEESPEVPEITSPIKTPAEAVEEPKAAEESSKVPEITSPIKTPSETAETPKPSSVQESKSGADSKQSKRSWTQRLGQWFKDTWNSFTQNLKRFGNWVKSMFSSKKKAD